MNCARDWRWGEGGLSAIDASALATRTHSLVARSRWGPRHMQPHAAAAASTINSENVRFPRQRRRISGEAATPAAEAAAAVAHRWNNNILRGTQHRANTITYTRQPFPSSHRREGPVLFRTRKSQTHTHAHGFVFAHARYARGYRYIWLLRVHRPCPLQTHTQHSRTHTRSHAREHTTRERIECKHISHILHTRIASQTHICM